jgi:hypothetical protein
MAIAMTKLAMLRSVIDVEDVVSVIYDMDNRDNYKDVLAVLKANLVYRQSKVNKLCKVAKSYYWIVKSTMASGRDISADEESDMFVWPNGRTNKVVADVMRDIPNLVRTSRRVGEFCVRLMELYGRSSFLCGVACQYMTNTSEIMLPPVENAQDIV